MEAKASEKDLRKFGLVVGCVFCMIGLWPVMFRDESVRLWALAAGATLAMLGGVFPRSLVHIHRGWLLAGLALGWINTRILLGAVYYGLITPIGIARRLIGKNSMRPMLPSEVTTYRTMRESRSRLHMRNQF